MTTDYLPCHVHGSWQHTVFSSRETREHADPIEGGLVEHSGVRKYAVLLTQVPDLQTGLKCSVDKKDTCAGVHFSLVIGS